MERGYLCLGGVEIANNCRTLSYIRNLGMPMLRTPPQPEACCCPSLDPRTTCTFAVTAGFDVSRDDCADLGFFSQGGLDLSRCSLRITVVNLGEGPIVRPATPTDGWEEVGTVSPVDPSMLSHSCAPYGPGLTAFENFELTELDSGATVSVMFYIDFASLAPGDYGNSAVSFDGGVTWVSAVTAHSFEVPCGAFTTPAGDDAPWYDPAQPESADFLGVYVEELLTPTPYNRTMRSKQRGGSLAPTQWGPREVHVTGWLYARSLAAAEFGKQWLFEALVDGSCADGCALPDLTMFRTCCSDPALADQQELRTLKGVGLVGPPNWALEPTFPPQAGCKFELTLQAEEPFMYGAEVSVASGLVYDLMADPECNICSPCSGPPDATPCLCGQLTSPERIVTRDGSDDAWCRPVQVRRRYVPMPATPLWKSAAAVVKIKAGTVNNALGRQGLANLRLLAFANPLGLTGPVWVDPDDIEHTEDYRSYFVCGEPCMSIEVACLPADSELVIDATRRTATVTCGNVTSSGYPYLSSNDGAAFAWPELDCVGMMVLIEADDLHTPPDTTFEVLSVPRDRV